MLSLQQAQALCSQLPVHTTIEEVPLLQAIHRPLAEDIHAILRRPLKRILM